MKSGFFPKRDEVVLSAMTALIVVGLVCQGLAALGNGKEHAIFQKNSVVVSKK